MAYGTWEATGEPIHSAAQAARIADVIESVPHKYDEIVGEKGSTLSGGDGNGL
jgi:ABC-type multidrug transport system fused ATPase/permease subunit